LTAQCTTFPAVANPMPYQHKVSLIEKAGHRILPDLVRKPSFRGNSVDFRS